MSKNDKDKEVIEYLLFRLGTIRDVFGTLTDKSVLTEENAGSFPAFSDNHIRILRRVVRTGIINDPILRPPRGTEVISFVIRLKTLQEKNYTHALLNEDAELLESVERMWHTLYEKVGKNANMARSVFREKWGPVDTPAKTKRLVNTAYRNASEKWEKNSQA